MVQVSVHEKSTWNFEPYPFSSSASSASMVYFDEASPVVFEMFPDDLDQIELGTVWRQMEEERFVFNEPAIQRSLVDAVMDARVIEHDHGGLAVALLEQRFDELNDMECLDSACVRGMDQRISAEVERADDRTPAVAAGFNGMGQAAW